MATRGVRHKHVRVDQEKFNRVKSILGATADTEAIERAMALVLVENGIIKTHRRIKGKGRIEKVFG